jgi:transcriptional regulator with XRE-family HTH domain
MGTRLKQLRAAIGLSQEEVAQRLGMSVSGYQRKETGKRGMNLAFAERLARVLGVPASAVLEAAGAADDMTPEQAEVLRLWSKLTAANRAALMRMLQLAAAEDTNSADGDATQNAPARGKVKQPMATSTAPGTRYQLHETPPPPLRR